MPIDPPGAADPSGAQETGQEIDVGGPRVERQVPSSGLAARLRWLFVWAGIVTLVALSVLAISHLLIDVNAVLGIRGGRTAVALRLAPVAALALSGLVLALLVVWLAGGQRRREMLAIGIGVAMLMGVRVFMAVQFDSIRFGEPDIYRAMGESILALDFDFVGRPMGYGMLLAGAFALSEDRQLAIEAVNLLLALMAGGVVLALARGLYGSRVGTLALLGYALWPAAALMTVVSIPQIAFDLAVVAGAWAALGLPSGRRGDASVGAILGLAQYLRPTAPFLLPAYILARRWSGGSWRDWLRTGGVTVATFLIVLAPVALYNLERTGVPSISTSDFGGHVLYIGTYVPSGGQFSTDANRALVSLSGTDDPLVRSAEGTAIALQRIRDDPLGIAALAIRKQDTLWGTEHYGVHYALRQRLRDRPQQRAATAPLLLSQGFYALLLTCASLGLVLRRRQQDALAALAISVVWTVSALHALLEVRDRHHSYAIPLLLPLAAYALVAIVDRGSHEVRRIRGR